MFKTNKFNNLISFFLITTNCIVFAFSCSNNETKSTEKNIINNVVLSKDIDELLKDTTKVIPIVDSLKQEFFVSTDSIRLDILAQLSENWRAFSFPLAQEVLSQSKKNKSTFTEGLAYCKFGIYYYRAYSLDSANYFLDKALQVGTKNNLKSIF